jgi:Nickel responsive protein SCO4226-like
MPRYLIERTFFVPVQEMQEVVQRSKQIAADRFPQISWEHSHVIVDEQGNVRTFCVYQAPDEGTIQRHAEAVGLHRVDRIHEIASDLTPADFPRG